MTKQEAISKILEFRDKGKRIIQVEITENDVSAYVKCISKNTTDKEVELFVNSIFIRKRLTSIKRVFSP